MESSFGTLKRRTTEMLESVQKSVPQRPNMPSMPAMPAMPNMSIAALARPAPYKATWEPILDVRLPLSSHSCDVVSGVAYIFGGEVEPRKPVDNVVHAVTLPMSSAPADYLKIPPKAAPVEQQQQQQSDAEAGSASDDKGNDKDLSDVPLEAVPENAPEEDAGTFLDNKGKSKAKATHLDDNVPAPRVGHATAVIGARVFLFGGRGGPDFTPLDEAGRVWVFDTRSHLWSYLDPADPSRFPASRSYHCATAADAPRDFTANHNRQPPKTWKQWAEGDSATVGTPQAPIVGNLAARATDEESDGYGTLIVHGGCLADGSRASDVWAFDVRSRVWSELPSAPGPNRGGAAICLSKNQNRLFRFGGFNGSEIGGQLDYIDFVVVAPDHGDDVTLTTRSSWQTITPAPSSSSSYLPSSSEAEPLNAPDSQSPHEWPGPRSVAGFECITVGGGRELLVLVMGERSPSASGHAGAGTFWDDVWVFSPPPKRSGPVASIASVAASLRRLWSKGASSAKDMATDSVSSPSGATAHVGEGSWARVATRPSDDEYEGDDEYDGDVVPRARGWFAMSTLGDVEGAGIVLWGGLRGDNKRLGDGWILRLD